MFATKYLYPEKETETIIRMVTSESLTSSYPKYVYYTGKERATTDLNLIAGFIIKGKGVVDFLEEKLEVLDQDDI